MNQPNRNFAPRDNYRSADPAPNNPPPIDFKAIIDEGDADKMVAAAKHLGEANKNVSSNQIRGIFSSVRQIQLSWDNDPKRAYRQAKLLQPRIAYAADRNALGTLKDIILQCIERVGGVDDEPKKRFSNFVDFFEAIVAYHKASGGKR